MCFEVLGFDIIIDRKLKPWLLEVNHTPSFGTDTPFDHKVKYGVINETMNIMNIKLKNRRIWRKQLQERMEKRMFARVIERLS